MGSCNVASLREQPLLQALGRARRQLLASPRSAAAARRAFLGPAPTHGARVGDAGVQRINMKMRAADAGTEKSKLAPPPPPARTAQLAASRPPLVCPPPPRAPSLLLPSPPHHTYTSLNEPPTTTTNKLSLEAVVVAHHVARRPARARVDVVQAHRVRRAHDLDDVLQDQEAEEGGEVELAEERRQDAAVDRQVGLGDLLLVLLVFVRCFFLLIMCRTQPPTHARTHARTHAHNSTQHRHATNDHT